MRRSVRAAGRLVRQCLTESGVLGLSGGALGALLAAVSVRPFVVMWPGSLPRAGEIRFDASVWLFTLAVSLVSSVLFGLAPALRIQMDSVEGALRAGARSTAGPSRALQSACVVAEVALAVVLLVSAGMLGRTLLALSSLNPGLNVHDVLTGASRCLPPSSRIPDGFVRRGRTCSTGQARCPAWNPPRWPTSSRCAKAKTRCRTGPRPRHRRSSQAPVALASTVTPDYLRVMGIPLRRGRFFDDHDRAGGEPVLVIDERWRGMPFGTTMPWAGDCGCRPWVPRLSASSASSATCGTGAWPATIDRECAMAIWRLWACRCG